MVAQIRYGSRRDYQNRIAVQDREPNRVIAVASSMGGIEALKVLVSALPSDFPGALLIVQHLSPRYKSHLTQILNRLTPLQVNETTEGMELRAGNIYVAPPDKHLIVTKGSLNLSDAPKEHFVRPSAEYTFKSLAHSYQERAVAVVLTGCDGDGKEGVKVVSEMGGKIIAQDRQTAKVFSMPESAIKTGCVDLILPINEVADGIVNMVLS